MPTYNIDKEQIDFVHKFDSESRGKFLIQVAFMEKSIDWILSNHFCNSEEKRNELIGFILNDFGFSLKIRNFMSLLNTKYPELHKKYPTLHSDLDGMRTLRNKFAHSIPDTTTEFLKKKENFIRLEYYKKGEKEHYHITKELIDKELKKSSTIITHLSEILNFISCGKSGMVGYHVN